jgi:hypothetical protein
MEPVAMIYDHIRITSEWLMSKHPELNEQDADDYRAFCEAHTICLKECYGEGEIMWPKWNEFQLEIASL